MKKKAFFIYIYIYIDVGDDLLGTRDVEMFLLLADITSAVKQVDMRVCHVSIGNVLL